MEASDLLRGMELAARQAGAIMLSADHIAEKVSSKAGHGNFVTEYDRRVQAFLSEALGRLLPEAGFIGEEDGKDVFTPEDTRGLVFCVDPIDGTANFLTGCRPSVTSIGLLKDGEPYMGVVYNPYSDILCAAVAGQGALCNGKPIRSSEAPLERSMVLFGTAPYYPEYMDYTFDLCKYYLPRSIDLRRVGCAAWDLCTVAMGAAGLYFEEHLSLWDYAAAALIAREAGCVLTDLKGSPLPFNGPSSMLCASAGVARESYFPPKEGR